MEEQPQEEQKPRQYTPAETARILGVSTKVLANKRREGKIQGIEGKRNITYYTMEQILAADMSNGKPGPKAGQFSRLGRAKYRWPGDKEPEDEGTGENKSLDYTGKTDSENSDNFSNRWRPSLKEATDARQLVGA